MNEETAASNAALPLIQEEGELRLLNSHIDVGIVHDDVGGFATELQRDTLQVVHVGVTHDFVADFSATSEGHLVHVSMLGNSFASDFTITRNNIKNTVGESRLMEKLTNAEAGQRCLLSWLHHDGAAGREGRCKLPSLHRCREIPRNDLPTNTDWLLTRVAEEGTVDGDRLPVDLVSPARIVAVHLQHEAKVNMLGDHERLAVVNGLESSELIKVSLNKIGSPMQDSATLGWRHAAPRPMIKCFPSGSDSQVHIFLLAGSNRADLLLGGRIKRVESFAAD